MNPPVVASVTITQPADTLLALGQLLQLSARATDFNEPLLYTNSALSAGVQLAAGGRSRAVVSDRNLKEKFRDEDGEGALAAIASMPIQSWDYKAQDPSIRHLGPMAQDFFAAFGLGIDDKHINNVGIDGINLLAVQDLETRTSHLSAENAELQARVR